MLSRHPMWQTPTILCGSGWTQCVQIAAPQASPPSTIIQFEVQSDMVSAIRITGLAGDDLLDQELRDETWTSLSTMAGGNKNNAIPRAAEAVILTKEQYVPEVLDAAASLEAILQAEYAVTDPDLRLSAAASEDGKPSDALTRTDTLALLALLSSIPDGVQRMDQHLDGLVETSLNLGVLYTSETELYAEYLLRSSSDSRLKELTGRISCIAGQAGARLETSDPYPAWEFVPKSAFRDKMVRIFEEQYGRKPVVETIHAGLECGLLSKKIPGLDAVSIGPDILDIHTSQERMSVSSVSRTYAYVRRILEDL